MKITQAMVLEVQRLLAEGKTSHRIIGRQLGLSRSTIGLIASGRRPAWPDRQTSLNDPLRPTGEVARCPSCGGRVHLPCRLCYVRRLKAGQRFG